MEEYIEDLIQSVLDQTYQDYTLILVNDASTDGSGEICNRYSLMDNRIKVIHHKMNQGAGVSRDDGYLMGTSEWVTFVDSDDILLPDFLSELVALIEPGVEVCGCRAAIVDGRQDVKNNAAGGDREKQYYSGQEMFYKIFTIGKGAIGEEVLWSKIIRRDLIEKFIGELRQGRAVMPRSYFNDYSFSIRLWYYCSTASYSNRKLYMYRVIHNSLSHIHKFTEHKRQLIVSYADGIRFLTTISNEITLKRQTLDCYVIVSEFFYMLNMLPCDNELRRKGQQTIGEFVADNYKYLSIESIYNYRKLMAFISVKVFCWNKKVWLNTVGRILYSIKYR